MNSRRASVESCTFILSCCVLAANSLERPEFRLNQSINRALREQILSQFPQRKVATLVSWMLFKYTSTDLSKSSPFLLMREYFF